MKDQTAGRSRRFDYRDVNKCAIMRGNGFLLTRLHRAGGVFVPSRSDRQKCHPAFCIFHTTDRSTDHSSVLGILCTVIIINLILSRYRLFISITGSKCGKRKRQYFRNRCETWNGIALASVTDMFTIHLFNNPISVHNRYGLPNRSEIVQLSPQFN